ncbi:aminodeoxychorismate lyase [Alteromonas halophila]|uniref:Aminodeoxychorismate lyase n=1 Tax=Alteromonas halophila TaxID=516698 RepID=A0A918MWQ2_9ALTE|nr:aminodeoxychorismate lyase [Alteromonas halophila]GGW76858.1 aminodeoxychorismate lyase [Alteromonas halophila]
MMTTSPTASTPHFALSDRAANYGDGVFTTMCVEDGKIALRNYHERRLLSDAERLSIVVDQAHLKCHLDEQAAKIGSGVLKVLLSAGEGGRGYARNEEVMPSFHASYHSLPAHYPRLARTGMALGIANTRLAEQPLLAGIKHLNRLEQVLIKAEIASMQCDDALVLDYKETLIEASAANVFWYKQGTWFTPELLSSGVAGVMRGFLLDWMASHQVPVEVGRFGPAHLNDATAVMLTNAVMTAMPVKSLQSKGTVHRFDLMPVTALQRAIAHDYKESYA